jgi:predicted enzyme related to lactoylglutathione lyase
MSDRTSYRPGTFSWVDLTTRDAGAAKSFYTDLFGWEYDDQPMGDGSFYSMATKDGKVVGALFASDEQPPHWNSYVTVASADDAATQAKDLGGTVVAGPFDVFDSGRMAVVQDPTGAFLSVWEPRSHPGAALVNAPGALTWNDLTTPDPDAATRFYGDWLGWRVEEVPQGDGYRLIWNGERTNGGMVPLRPEMGEIPPNWMPYFGALDGLIAAIDRVKELGGELHHGPVEVPQGSFAVMGDPQGAWFALWGGTYDD